MEGAPAWEVIAVDAHREGLSVAEAKTITANAGGVTINQQVHGVDAFSAAHMARSALAFDLKGAGL